jgi:hypothetical protein
MFFQSKMIWKKKYITTESHGREGFNLKAISNLNKNFANKATKKIFKDCFHFLVKTSEASG